jgi:hypothetical protein
MNSRSPISILDCSTDDRLVKADVPPRPRCYAERHLLLPRPSGRGELCPGADDVDALDARPPDRCTICQILPTPIVKLSLQTGTTICGKIVHYHQV